MSASFHKADWNMETRTTLLLIVIFILPGPSRCQTKFRMGLVIMSGANVPFDLKRIGAAIQIGINTVHNEILNSSYSIEVLDRPYGWICNTANAAGKTDTIYISLMLKIRDSYIQEK